LESLKAFLLGNHLFPSGGEIFLFQRMPWGELDEMRITPESSDIEDLKLLIKIVKIKTVEEGIDIIRKYYPEELIPQRTYYALDELLNAAFVENGVDKAKGEIGA
jgi:hypothetical protein